MYKLIAIAFLGFILIQPTSAQERPKDKPEHRAEMKELKTKFFNEELQLTEEEQKAFWPLYENFRQHRKGIKGKAQRPKLELMSDAEVEKHIEDMFNREEQRLAEKRKLYAALRGKIGIRKIALLPEVEKKFKRALVRKMKEKRKYEPEGKPKIRR